MRDADLSAQRNCRVQLMGLNLGDLLAIEDLAEDKEGFRLAHLHLILLAAHGLVFRHSLALHAC